jgi:glycosyltransferase involved in cell wall biosynthesis
MKIAIMMRAMDQDSGHQSITMGLVENMLRIDDNNTYLLLYRTKKFLGRFSKYSNAEEKLITAPHKFLWDQIAVPFHAWKEQADIIYNPKFSIPLISHCPVVMGLHEPAWWAWPDHYEWFDRNYMKLMLPIYISKAKHLFPISQFIVDECKKYIRRPFNNVTVAYPAPKPYFKVDMNAQLLENSRKKYALPEKFIFAVTRVDHPGLDKSDSFFAGKNVETTVRAFLGIQEQVPHKLVIAGRRVKAFLLHVGLEENQFENIVFLDFVPHQELPAMFNLADIFILPSFYESYAMALVEAMSCGCAIVASETGACPEITAGAALLANPYEPDDFAEKIKRILTNGSLKTDLESKSIERAKFFTWERTAQRTIKEIARIVEKTS